ncbi:MAG: DUF1638 domain-containing protein [Deltaproteobacteria bacterium]|jgi:hypothetical protein|nr:DUF1638 domain-containing protein [Deltaproteobacteria bacterium]
MTGFMTNAMTDSPAKGLGIVACDVVKNELERVRENKDVRLRCLEYALHEKPKEMPGAIVKAVEEMLATGEVGKVALGYGLCSNGTVGVSCRNGTVVPRCHDCISMLLGSPARYMKMFRECPGTYFLTDGWIRNRGDPVSTVEFRYAPKMGEKKAWKGMKLELANYKRICFVNNGVGDEDALRRRALENAKAFDKEFMEVKADLGFFEKLVGGSTDEDCFIILGPGEKVDEGMFYASPETFPLTPAITAAIAPAIAPALAPATPPSPATATEPDPAGAGLGR